MQFIFQPSVREVAPIRGSNFNPNSVIPSLSQVNTNPVNISPFFQGEQSRIANIQSELSIRDQALREQRFVLEKDKHNLDLMESLFNNVNSKTKAQANADSKSLQNVLLNTQTGLNVLIPKQAEQHQKITQILNSAQQRKIDLVSGIDFQSGVNANDIARISTEMQKIDADTQKFLNSDPEYLRSRAINSRQALFNDRLAKAKDTISTKKVNEIRQRLNYYAGVPGNYPPDIENKGIPDAAEIEASIQPFQGVQDMKDLRAQAKEVLDNSVEVQSIVKLLEEGNSLGGDALYTAVKQKLRDPDSKVAKALENVVNSPQFQDMFDEYAFTTMGGARINNPNITFDQNKSSIKENFLEELLSTYSVDKTSRARRVLAEENVLKNLDRGKASTSKGGGSSQASTDSSTATEREFARDRAIANAAGVDIDSIDTNNMVLVQRAGGFRNLGKPKDLGDFLEYDVPIFKQSGSPDMDDDDDQIIRKIKFKKLKGVPEGSTTSISPQETINPDGTSPSGEFVPLGDSGISYIYLGDGRIQIRGLVDKDVFDTIDNFNLYIQNGKIKAPRIGTDGKIIDQDSPRNTGKKKEPKQEKPRTREDVQSELNNLNLESGEDEFGQSNKPSKQLLTKKEKLEKELKSFDRQEILKAGRDVKVNRATEFLNNLDSGKNFEFKFEGFNGKVGRARVSINVVKSKKDPNNFLVKEGSREIGILTLEEIISKYIK